MRESEREAPGNKKYRNIRNVASNGSPTRTKKKKKIIREYSAKVN